MKNEWSVALGVNLNLGLYTKKGWHKTNCSNFPTCACDELGLGGFMDLRVGVVDKGLVHKFGWGLIVFMAI